MSVSRSTAGDVLRWVTEGSVVTFLRPKYGIFWCRSTASILDPSPSVPIWPMMSQLVCILLWENDEKKDPERLPGSCWHQWFPIKRTSAEQLPELSTNDDGGRKYTLLFSQSSLLKYLVSLTEFGEFHYILWTVLEKVWKALKRFFIM